MTKAKSHWSGSEYHNNALFQYNTFMSLLKTIHINGNENILDIGCGDGKITHELSLRAKNGLILGIDREHVQNNLDILMLN